MLDRSTSAARVKPGAETHAHASTNSPSGGQDDANPILAIALWALESGLWPVAVHPYDAKVSSPGKAPIGQGWGKDRPDAASIHATFRRYPKANVGLKLGADGGVIDMDVDQPEHAGATLARMFPDGIPSTKGWTNADGKFHLLFLWDDRLAGYGKSIIKGVVGPGGEITGNPNYLGLEIRIGAAPGSAKQFQTVIPPSLMVNGVARRWNDHAEILPLPESVFADMDRHAIEKPVNRPAPPEKEKRIRGPVSSADRYALAALEKEAASVASSAAGGRNDALNGAAFALGQLVGAGALDRATVEDALRGSAYASGLSGTEIEKTLGSGLEAGMREPRDLSSVGKKTAVVVTPHIIPFPGAEERNRGELEPNEAADDPSRLARLFLDQACRHKDGLTLRFHSGEWLEWAGAYRPVLAEDVRARLHGTIKAEFDRLNLVEIGTWAAEQSSPEKDGLSAGKKPKPKARKVTTGLVNNTVLGLTGYTHLNPRTSPPAWLIEQPPFPPEDVLPTRNALVHLPGLVASDPRAIHPPTPGFFGYYSLGYDFQADASRPSRWCEFLASIWPDDAESIDALQEWFGHLLTPDTNYQKILMLIGPKRSGKGTMARVLRAMIGAENVANPTLASLATNFGLAPLIGKPAAVIGDARLSGRTDVAQIVERLLSISGEDALTIDRKHLPAVTVKLPTRFTLISNELPRLSDASGAMTGRLILLRLTRSFYGQEDRKLMDALMSELPGILLWAIEGWRRLRDRGRFTQPATGQALIEEMEDLSSPVGAFLKDCCAIEPGAEVQISALFGAWRAWCQERGRENHGDEMMFGRNLRAVLPNLNTAYRRQPDGTRKRCYEGIRLTILPREWA